MANRLNVAVVHYHLKPGGVTRVMENTVAALHEAGRDIQPGFIAGPPTRNRTLEPCVEIHELQYATGKTKGDASALAEKLNEAAESLFGRPPDLWHIHNHSLGKNPVLSASISIIAAAGIPMLLHLHDFAEDGRPENYKALNEENRLPARLYPQAGHIGYAVLNGRDYQHLKNAGVPEERLHLLPNPVADPSASSDEIPFQELDPRLQSYQSLVLYPVRATRRKNFGELLLWAASHRRDSGNSTLGKAYFVNSLGPSNPDFKEQFERWKEFARARKLPVYLGFGESTDHPFEKLVSASTALITTSVAEGFGLGFLEPWIFEKPLTGRNICEITRDFEDAGVNLSSLYHRLEIPVSWIGGNDILKKQVHEAMEKTYASYGKPWEAGHLDSAMEALVRNERVDFGRLSEPLQERAIDHLIENPDAAENMHPSLLPEIPDGGTIASNARNIREHFSLKAYGNRLSGIYRSLCDATPENSVPHPEFLDPHQLLSQFLKPESFNLLRT